MNRKLLILLMFGTLFSGCASRSFRFADAPAVWDLQDRQPIPLPETTKYIRADYYFSVLVRRPAVSAFNFVPGLPAQDVNAVDQVPKSSWFNPRLGFREISPQEMVTGPEQIGPPKPPVRVVRAKHRGRNPGFVIADSRDRLYLVKFDPPNFPGVETTTAFIVNRLFWAFGYNVPEDYTFYFNSAEVPIDSTADITEEEVQLVLGSVAPPQDGLYRATASLLIDGIYLGPIDDKGTREDDPNDRIPHQDRRVMRALKVFGAFTNQTDIRIDNSLDVYEETDGKGFVRHYLLDFGESLGAHGTERGRLWDGFAHVFSFREMFGNIATLGLRVNKWEHIGYTPWPSVGTFEADLFEPLKWKEAYPFEPIRKARPDDCYWAAKIVAELTREQLAALVSAANYPEPEAADYVLETLLKRRQKIIDAHFGTVSPVEFAKLDGDTLHLVDLGKVFGTGFAKTRYRIRRLSDSGKQMGSDVWVEGTENEHFTVPINPSAIERTSGYLRVSVQVWRDGKAAPRWAEFHLRSRKSGQIVLAGVVH